MKYSVTSARPDSRRAGCLVIGIHEGGEPAIATAALDRAVGGILAAALARGDLEGKAGQTLLLHTMANGAADRLLLVGLGRKRDLDEAGYRKACAAAARALRATGATDAVSYLTHSSVRDRDRAWHVREAVLATEDELYRFDACRGEKARAEKSAPKLAALAFDLPRAADLKAGERGLRTGAAIAAGVALAKDLGNAPANVCTPAYLADQARALGRQHAGIKVKVLEREQIEKLGMGSFLSVARGSRQPPKLILLEFRNGPKSAKPVALVGKGITFDSGGISIKPADKMDEMKFDMCGGAAVLGAFKAAALLDLPVNLVGAVPACENLPDGLANKPGDIVTSMAGITIEVLNTDAEGRLILCDALTYVEREYEPAVCIDVATLTGACVVALGGIPSGLFSNTPALAQALLDAGEDTGDRAWQLPLWEDYQGMLKSEHADVANVTGGREGGAITAACFLHRFTRKMKWAHLDVAGTAWRGKRATGRPVPLLVQYLAGSAGGKQ